MKCVFIDLGKHFGGAEKYLLTIVHNWISRGNEAIIVLRKNSVFAKRIVESGINVQLEEVDFSFKDIYRIKKVIATESVDILNVNGINSGVFVRLLNIKIPIITTVHSNAELDRIDKNILLRKMFVKAENICLRKSKKIIVVSDAIRELLISRGVNKNKIVTIHNGVKKIEYNNSSIICEDGMLKICFVGRLEKVKGCCYLLRALAEMQEIKYLCDIYGEGSLKEELVNLSAELGINTNVYFKGFSNKVRELLPQYDTVVLPSLYEAFPLTIPEAMNSKTIVVCSDVGGLPWIISDKVNGYVFKCGNTKQLTEILLNIYYYPDAQNKIVEQAYSDFETKYTEECMIKKTFTLYEEVMALRKNNEV